MRVPTMGLICIAGALLASGTANAEPSESAINNCYLEIQSTLGFLAIIQDEGQTVSSEVFDDLFRAAAYLEFLADDLGYTEFSESSGLFYNLKSQASMMVDEKIEYAREKGNSSAWNEYLEKMKNCYAAVTK